MSAVVSDYLPASARFFSWAKEVVVGRLNAVFLGTRVPFTSQPALKVNGSRVS
jgi:hypothetical protein